MRAPALCHATTPQCTGSCREDTTNSTFNLKTASEGALGQRGPACSPCSPSGLVVLLVPGLRGTACRPAYIRSLLMFPLPHAGHNVSRHGILSWRSLEGSAEGRCKQQPQLIARMLCLQYRCRLQAALQRADLLHIFYTSIMDPLTCNLCNTDQFGARHT